MVSEEIGREWEAEQVYLLRDALLGRTGEMARRYQADAEFRHGIDLMAATLPTIIKALAETCDKQAVVRKRLMDERIWAPGPEF